MSRPKRGLLVVVVIALLVVGAEVGLNLLRSPVGLVRVLNQGQEPITGLQLDSGGSHASWPKIEPGESVVVRLSGRGKSTLKVSFQQRGNALSGFEIPDFHPSDLQSLGNELVLEIRNNEFMRYQDVSESESPSALGRLGRNIRDWVGDGSATTP